MLRAKGIPLYYQIGTILRKKILSGELPSGSVLPSEDVLAEDYEVSRITVRQALALLEQDGLLIRQRGKGTFVSDKARFVEPQKLTGFIEDLILMGVKTKIKVLDLGMRDATETIRDRLKLDESAKVFQVRKIRKIEGNPFSYVLNYFPPDIGMKLKRSSLAVKPALTILEEDLGLKVSEAIQTIEATVADAEVAPLLDVRVGEPLLKAERTVFDVKKKPIEYVYSLYRSDKYCFTVKLERKRSKDFVGWEAI
jgi:GntR family transcriptional regulator